MVRKPKSYMDMVIPCQASYISYFNQKGGEQLKSVKKDIVGRTFGSLRVLDIYEQRGEIPDRKTYWLCECTCGNQLFVERDSLQKRKVNYCNKCRPAGIRNSKLYHVYHGMKQRCNNPNNPNYKKYGGAGIKVCSEWADDYSIFEKWAYESGYSEGLTIDRIDSRKGYSPGNCRWITLSENGARANRGRVKNRSKLKCMYAISPEGERAEIDNIKQFALSHNLNYSTVMAAVHGRCAYKKSGWKFYSNIT